MAEDATRAEVAEPTGAPRDDVVRATPRPGRDFYKLWAALTVSLVGSEITTLALPLIAALTLDATAFEMGVLAAVGQAPFLVCSLPAGVWVDRVRRKPVLIASDVGSALLLLSIPLAVPLGGPVFTQLCVVAFGVGTFTVISQVAHYAYVPSLVGRQHLTECNSRLQISHSASAAAGPGIGGFLVQVLSAPLAVLADALSFLLSAVLLRAIRTQESSPERDGDGLTLRRAVSDGVRMLLGHHLLRPVVLMSTMAAFFEAGLLALYVLYATRELELSPAMIGLVFAAGGIGAIPGALLARWAGGRWGVGRAIIGGWTLAALAGLLVPLAAGPVVVVVGILAFAKVWAAATDTVANIHQWTLRQAVTPDRLAGRVTASHRFLVYGSAALGALAGGTLGGVLGLRGALFVCAAGMLLAPLWGLFSPLRELREQPVDVDDVVASGEPPEGATRP